MNWNAKWFYLAALIAGLTLYACGGGGGGGGGGGSPGTATRPYWMGTTPFFATPSSFPDWQFENLEDKDLLSIHADDFWGVPWEQCNASGCTPPAAWVSKWTSFANSANSQGKTLYLALSPLQDRKRLAPKVDNTTGNPVPNWEAPAQIDANSCYRFSTDANAATYKAAYISYVKYLVNLVGARYITPSVEMNIQFTQCPSQKAAWIAWYTDVHNALKAEYPSHVIFPTFQMEHMYGISNPQAACSTGTLAACFDQRLAEALTIPGDRIAFSSYPIGWKYLAEYSFSYPTDTYARVQNATTRKIWMAETGWSAVAIKQSYEHAGTSTCGADLFPAAMANNTEQEAYMRWLLVEAQTRGFESVIWWLNRDFLDGTVATTCPCNPAASDTCVLSNAFYSAAGTNGEVLMRFFGNMALRNYDGSARPARSAWREYFDRRLSQIP